MLVEEKIILDIIENFKKKKKSLLQEVKDTVKEPTSEALINVEIKLEEIHIKVKARIFLKIMSNRGYRKYSSNCEFFHIKEDCEQHLTNGKCKGKSCLKRHTTICKYWESKEGCFRGRHCEYLHEDLGSRTTNEATNIQVSKTKQQQNYKNIDS